MKRILTSESVTEGHPDKICDQTSDAILEAYASRWVSKNLVAAGVADRLEIQLAYAIGVAEPVSIEGETFGTEKVSHEKIVEIVKSVFDLRPSAIIR